MSLYVAKTSLTVVNRMVNRGYSFSLHRFTLIFIESFITALRAINEAFFPTSSCLAILNNN